MSMHYGTHQRGSRLGCAACPGPGLQLECSQAYLSGIDLQEEDGAAIHRVKVEAEEIVGDSLPPAVAVGRSEAAGGYRFVETCGAIIIEIDDAAETSGGCGELSDVIFFDARGEIE